MGGRRLRTGGGFDGVDSSRACCCRRGSPGSHSDSIPTDRAPIAPIGIDVSTDGDRPVRTLVYGEWNDLDVRLREADPMIGVRRVNLRVERTWQPAL